MPTTLAPPSVSVSRPLSPPPVRFLLNYSRYDQREIGVVAVGVRIQWLCLQPEWTAASQGDHVPGVGGRQPNRYEVNKHNDQFSMAVFSNWVEGSSALSYCWTPSYLKEFNELTHDMVLLQESR